jgi:hypothetical protein
VDERKKTKGMTLEQQKPEQTALVKQPLSDGDVLRHQAATLVSSGFLPTAINTWQKATAIIMYGKELGMGPMESIQSIDVIQGKPTQKPQSMKAMIHKKLPTAIFRIARSDDKECVIEAARPNEAVTKFTFTIEDAARLNLVNKDNWKKQPKVMLMWRCIGHVARTVFPDCLSGVSYTPEEMGAEVDDEHNIIEVKPQSKGPEAIEIKNVYIGKPDEPAISESVSERSGGDSPQETQSTGRIRSRIRAMDETAGTGQEGSLFKADETK